MAGRNLLDFIPPNKGAGVRANKKVEDWVQLWWNDASKEAWCGHKLKVLEPKDWFDLPNNESPRLWLPPSCYGNSGGALQWGSPGTFPYSPCICCPSSDDTFGEKALVERC